jgi:kanosamine-6-phosphate phosphatase
VAYYYNDNASREKDFERIARIAREHDLRVLFAKCSPAAGDPPGAYDVEFVPLCCGKDKAVEFLQSRFGLKRESLYGFGDGFNDFPMFDAVGNGFLVKNALPAVVEKRASLLARPYCFGIVDVLERLKAA